MGGLDSNVEKVVSWLMIFNGADKADGLCYKVRVRVSLKSKTVTARVYGAVYGAVCAAVSCSLELGYEQGLGYDESSDAEQSQSESQSQVYSHSYPYSHSNSNPQSQLPPSGEVIFMRFEHLGEINFESVNNRRRYEGDIR